MPKYKEFIRQILGDRVVAYYPSLAHKFGVKSAILLSQLFHYASLQEDPEDWFHIKIKTITSHTGLSRKEQGAARKVLSQWGVLQVKRKGMPRKNLYLVDLEALVLAVSEDKQLPEPSSQESPKGTHKGGPKVTTCEAQRDPCIKESLKEESIKEKTGSNDRGKKKSQPASIKIFRDKAHRFPAKAWWELVDETVGDDEKDLKLWGEIVFNWVGLGWNPMNVAGMLEFYHRREIPSMKYKYNEPKQKSVQGAKEFFDDLRRSAT